MATSGTSVFQPDASEIIEEAYERIGIEALTGYDIRTARRSLNLLALEWANRQVNLWSIDSNTIALLPAVAVYTLPADTIDLLDVVIRTTQGGTNSDLSIGRLSTGDYAAIPSKQSPGRPVNFYINRQAAAPTVTIWPVPPASSAPAWAAVTHYLVGATVVCPVTVGTFTAGQVISANATFTSSATFNAAEAANWGPAQDYTFVYWRMRRLQDAGLDGSITSDAPARMIPALIAGLAYYLAMKRAPQRLADTKAIYDEQWQMAAEEDRERAVFSVTPRMAYV